MVESGLHFWRGFWIALLLTLGLPLVAIALAMVVPGAAMVYAYTLAPQLVYAYPPLFLLPSSGVATMLALLVAVLLALGCGFLTRHRGAAVQWLMTLGLLGAWWLAWRLVALLAGIEPSLGVRM